MVDTDHSGTVNLEEFIEICDYIDLDFIKSHTAQENTDHLAQQSSGIVPAHIRVFLQERIY
eukprot:CAMPEP_0201559442 /NCGR_PEP_ID=MMETSP0173_2-20130828/74187_1 /ASSEMBLY_ACC=CAM_ASM_000268 /TAXON_ID=218659 /ORGANISM="Vexillifera sp., Strain DIVA3 564/2" /LENGTH=60 /DNA_ID=CAMNT_0047973461 /DNA_START=110 /DNA_END=289 /DNA_ORIENTATION=+